MKKKAVHQYTIRGISSALDKALREKAVKERSSLNEAAVTAMEKGLGVSDSSLRYDDLDDLAGTWVDDPGFDRALKSFQKIDGELW